MKYVPTFLKELEGRYYIRRWWRGQLIAVPSTWHGISLEILFGLFAAPLLVVGYYLRGPLGGSTVDTMSVLLGVAGLLFLLISVHILVAEIMIRLWGL